MKYLILTLALISQTAFATSIIERRELSPNITLIKYEDGIIFKDYWAELTHPTCEIYVPTGTHRSVLNGLVEWGYFPVETLVALPINDALNLSDVQYESFENRNECAQTNLSMRLNFARTAAWIPFYFVDNYVACMADTLESQMDVRIIFIEEQLPKCVRSN